MTAAEAYTRLSEIYDEIVVDPCYDRSATFLHELWQSDQAGVHAVLDVCCGTGLMAEELVACGYRVVGVDGSATMLSRARQRLGPQAVLVQEMLRKLRVDGSFDAAVSTFDRLNYLTPTQFRDALVAVSRRLRSGGWLVFDLHTDTMMDFTTSNPVVTGISDGYQFTIGGTLDVRARLCETRIDVTRTADRDTFTERHRQYFFTDEQVRRALVEAGFGQVTVTDEYSQRPAGPATLRATWTARRLPAEPSAELGMVDTIKGLNLAGGPARR